MSKKEHRYLSIDLETTGLSSEHCSILEVGVVIEDWETPIDELPVFRCFLESKDWRDGEQYFTGASYALWLNAEILRYLAVYPKTLGEALAAGFEEFVPIYTEDRMAVELRAFLWHNQFNLKNHLTAAGKNFSGFDLGFLNKVPALKGSHIQFRHRSIDPTMYYWDRHHDGNRLPDLKTCLERAGIDGEVQHRAVDDAKDVIKLLRHAGEVGLMPGGFSR